MEGSCSMKLLFHCLERWRWQLKADPPEIKVAPNMSEGFYSALGLKVGTTYQLFQRGKHTPNSSMDRWGLTAVSWALMRFSTRGSDPFSCDPGLLSSREPAMRLSIVLVLDRQFSSEAGFKHACQILSLSTFLLKNFLFPLILVVILPNTSASGRKSSSHLPFNSKTNLPWTAWA